MVDEVPLRKAVDTAWTVYLATHRDVDVAEADDAYWNAICKGGWKPVKARLKNSRVPDSLTSTGFPRQNGEADRATDRTANRGKRKAGLDVARSLVPAFRDAGLDDAIHT